jgi:hypothetical protein
MEVFCATAGTVLNGGMLLHDSLTWIVVMGVGHEVESVWWVLCTNVHANIVNVIGCRFGESKSRWGFLFAKVEV